MTSIRRGRAGQTLSRKFSLDVVKHLGEERQTPASGLGEQANRVRLFNKGVQFWLEF